MRILWWILAALLAAAVLAAAVIGLYKYKYSLNDKVSLTKFLFNIEEISCVNLRFCLTLNRSNLSFHLLNIAFKVKAFVLHIYFAI